MIEFLTNTNQSLLNQVRAKDLATLSGLEQMRSPEPTDAYISTDAREMQAYYDSLTNPPVGESFSDEDLENLRNAL